MQQVLLSLTLIMSITAIQAGQNIGVFVPEANKDVDAGSYILANSPSSFHFQILYDSSLFRDVPEGGGFLRGIHFRTDQLFGSNASGPLNGAEIIASTTQKDSKSLSAIFAENLGPDAKVYLDSKLTTQYASSWQGNNKVSDFFAIGSSGDGFFYDPSKGNLLLDFKNVSFPFGLDAYLANSPFVVSAVQEDLFGAKGELSTLTPVTLLNFYVVPEPGSAALLIGGVSALYATRRRTTSTSDKRV